MEAARADRRRNSGHGRPRDPHRSPSLALGRLMSQGGPHV
jgi:hypothetical protein